MFHTVGMAARLSICLVFTLGNLWTSLGESDFSASTIWYFFAGELSQLHHKPSFDHVVLESTVYCFDRCRHSCCFSREAAEHLHVAMRWAGSIAPCFRLAPAGAGTNCTTIALQSTYGKFRWKSTVWTPQQELNGVTTHAHVQMQSLAYRIHDWRYNEPLFTAH